MSEPCGPPTIPWAEAQETCGTVWKDAYTALQEAQRLRAAGYSVPVYSPPRNREDGLRVAATVYDQSQDWASAGEIVFRSGRDDARAESLPD